MTGPTEAQHRRMHMLWRKAAVAERTDRLALTGAIVRRRLGSSDELTVGEAARVIDYLEQLDAAGQLAERAARWLARHIPPDAPVDTRPPAEPAEGELSLFDVEAPPAERGVAEQLSADRRRTVRQLEAIEQRQHPLSLALGWHIPLRADAPAGKEGDGPRCGTCRFRELLHHHNRTYPKCTAADGTRMTHGAGTDLRAWWPACRDFELGDPGAGPDAARWNPTREETDAHAR